MCVCVIRKPPEFLFSVIRPPEYKNISPERKARR